MAYAVQAGDPAPAWQARDLDGYSVRFPEQARGRTTVLVFWATWCPYCQVFMPRLAGIESDYMTRGVRVLAINCKEDGRDKGGDPVAYLREHGYTFQAVLHGDAIAELYDVQFIPGLMIVGMDGQVIYRRKSTDLPAGREIAEFWDQEVRSVLDGYLD
jgi:thiol-disulfide isomerase/thioredoxin